MPKSFCPYLSICLRYVDQAIFELIMSSRMSLNYVLLLLHWDSSIIGMCHNSLWVAFMVGRHSANWAASQECLKFILRSVKCERNVLVYEDFFKKINQAPLHYLTHHISAIQNKWLRIEYYSYFWMITKSCYHYFNS